MAQSKEIFMQEREWDLMNSIPLSKSAIAQKANEAIEHILEVGNYSHVAQMLSAMEKFVDSVKKDERFVNAIREDLERNNKSFVLPTGTKIELAEVGVKYDYSSDPMWSELEAQIKPIRDKQKEREEYLKKIPAGKMLMNEEGEVLAVGPAKSSTSSFKVSLAK